MALIQRFFLGLFGGVLPAGQRGARTNQIAVAKGIVNPANRRPVFICLPVLRFNQPVGKLMKGATAEVEKFMKVRHAGKLPADYTVEFGFANKYSLKDGPSAAVI